MMIQCDIVSAEREIFSGPVEMLVASGIEGDVGILYGHAPLLTALRPGPVRLKMRGDTEDVFYVSGGFLEVQPHTVTILADTVLREDDMDEASAAEAQKQAAQSLQDAGTQIDYTRAAAQFAQAAAQLRTLQTIRNKNKR